MFFPSGKCFQFLFILNIPKGQPNNNSVNTIVLFFAIFFRVFNEQNRQFIPRDDRSLVYLKNYEREKPWVFLCLVKLILP